jgi:hypothetical protein
MGGLSKMLVGSRDTHSSIEGEVRAEEEREK